MILNLYCLSGTPAEAGVRGVRPFPPPRPCRVSVEPLPKQGCEVNSRESFYITTRLSGTPAEAGVRGVLEETFAASEESQWNPCRSRGASRNCFALFTAPMVSVEPLPKQGCELSTSRSTTYPP